MSPTQYYFFIAVSIGMIVLQFVIMILREAYHVRIQAGLIDKILEQHGLNAIPKEHPLAELVSTIREKAEEKPEPPPRMRIPVPGMAAFQHQYNRVLKVKEKDSK